MNKLKKSELLFRSLNKIWFKIFLNENYRSKTFWRLIQYENYKLYKKILDFQGIKFYNFFEQEEINVWMWFKMKRTMIHNWDNLLEDDRVYLEKICYENDVNYSDFLNSLFVLHLETKYYSIFIDESLNAIWNIDNKIYDNWFYNYFWCRFSELVEKIFEKEKNNSEKRIIEKLWKEIINKIEYGIKETLKKQTDLTVKETEFLFWKWIKKIEKSITINIEKILNKINAKWYKKFVLEFDKFFDWYIFENDYSRLDLEIVTEKLYWHVLLIKKKVQYKYKKLLDKWVTLEKKNILDELLSWKLNSNDYFKFIYDVLKDEFELLKTWIIDFILIENNKD